ncbi:MAG: flavodoxin [Flavobacteriaceae bacterium CG02_land_8_20_14_3_00_34_13]|nr:flavodoxin family protein [Flavobacteriia bacterium]PIV48860.1 MAG: flavodoxin [Flavobacteriaceae bacterium CG02_land_8_20_14_3_00_34_13]PIZ08334.1 MAG: flavodoxin [Flavobacteriaceae bacterium CG_4_10_14_0_8_um_filter_34_31]PJC06142.1 MAG: flavodoxin [Flavobacteriaceae bacterium CG_4_9_14_0_8_um_filter_34_30]
MKKNTQNTDFTKLKAVFVNCTLKKSPTLSHTQGLMDVSKQIMKSEGVEVETIRLVDYDIPVGVQPDMTKEGETTDAWPKIYKKIKKANILIIGSPIWLGERSSIASKLIERLYAMSGLQNEKGQYVYYGKAGGCIITGNEDGVKHCAMGILYALQHLGYSIPPQADAGWIGEVGPGPSYGDTEWNGKKIDPPVGINSEFTNRNTTFMTYNLLHLAKMLKDQGGYPAYGNSRKEWDDGTRWNFENPEYR